MKLNPAKNPQHHKLPISVYAQQRLAPKQRPSIIWIEGFSMRFGYAIEGLITVELWKITAENVNFQ